MQLVEHRIQPQGLADLLLYDSLVEDGILLQQDGSLLAAWSFRGPDMASATHAEMAALSARLNNILRLGSGWMIHCDAIRTKAPDYPTEGAFPDTITRIIDAERREQFTAQGTHFESDYFLTLTYLPPLESEERIAAWLFEGQKQKIGAASRALSRFRTKLASSKTFSNLYLWCSIPPNMRWSTFA
jgi:type IV secretion system protein VirB4